MQGLVINWPDMGSRGAGRRQRQCPGFHLVNYGHGGTINQEKNLREVMGLRDKMLILC